MNTKLPSLSRPYTPVNKDKIIARDKITILRIHSDCTYPSYKFLSKTFRIISDYKALIELVNITETSISVAMSQIGSAEELRTRLNGFAHTEASYNWSVIHIIPDTVPNDEALHSSLVIGLREIPLRMISYTGCKNIMSVVVHIKDKHEACDTIKALLRKRLVTPLKKEIVCV